MTTQQKPQWMSEEEWIRLCNEAQEKLVTVTRALKEAGAKLRVENGTTDLARIGYWLWCEGEEIKQSANLRGILKGHGFKFNGKREAFGWTPKPWRGKRSPKDLDHLANKYGYQLAR